MHFKFLQKSQWWGEEELKNYQNKKLSELIQHSYHNVTYYKELLDGLRLKPCDIKTTEDLQKLPILTKEIVRENVKNGKLIFKNIKKKDMILNGSSGSTGEPLQYYITKDAYSFNIAANLRGWYWMGYRLGDRYSKLSQNPRNGIIKKIQDKINNCHYTLSQSLSIDDVKNIVISLKKSNVKIIRGYPSTIYILSNYIEKHKTTDIKLSSINTTGEILFPYMRKKIEEIFKCKIFDSYSGEGGALGFECDTHEKYHLASEYAFTEIIPNYKFNMGKEKGEIVSTDFWNYATPLIRYNSKDVAVISKKGCNCNRVLPVIDRIEGRDVDILVTPSGKSLIVHYFTGYFEWVDSVSQFQVIQTRADRVILKLVVNNNFNKIIKEKIYNDIRIYIGNDVDFSIEVVDEIPINPKNGKRRFVINNTK